MSASLARGFALVSPRRHAQLGLLEGWKFFRVPLAAGFLCSLCGRPAAFATAPDRLPRCERHARDF